MITLEYIKNLVEDVSTVNNIDKKTRERNYLDLRSVYYELARKYTYKDSLHKIGIIMGGLGHATIINGLKRFEALYGTNSFTANNIYDICDKKLYSISVQYDNIKSESRIEELDNIIAFCKKEKQNVLMDIKVEYEQIK